MNNGEWGGMLCVERFLRPGQRYDIGSLESYERVRRGMKA